MSMPSKVVIPVAGLGTRVLPASKAIPKEMLTVVDKPVIQYVVEEAVKAGFRHIIFITRAGKSAIEDHFDYHYELEAELGNKGKADLLASIQTILPADVTITSVRQPKALGLGHAVLCAEAMIGDDDFAVMLPDMLIQDQQDGNDMSRMVERYRSTGFGQIMVEEVPHEQVSLYGIIDCQGHSINPGDGARIHSMVEKPAPATAPSNLAIVGRYILPGRIMKLLRQTAAGSGGEIQLTDAMHALLSETQLEAYSMTGHSFDCGNKLGLLKANIAFGLQHPETAGALKAYLQSL